MRGPWKGLWRHRTEEVTRLRGTISRLELDLSNTLMVNTELRKKIVGLEHELAAMKREVLPIGSRGVGAPGDDLVGFWVSAEIEQKRERDREYREYLASLEGAFTARYEAKTMSDEGPIVEVSGPDPLGVEAYLNDAAAEEIDMSMPPIDHVTVGECSCGYCEWLRNKPANDEGQDEG